MAPSQPSFDTYMQFFDSMAAKDSFARAVRKGEKAEAAALSGNQSAGQTMGLESVSVDIQYLDHEMPGRWGYAKSVKRWTTRPKIFDVMLKDLGRLSEEPALKV
jgi:hypothetical protein